MSVLIKFLQIVTCKLTSTQLYPKKFLLSTSLFSYLLDFTKFVAFINSDFRERLLFQKPFDTIRDLDYKLYKIRPSATFLCCHDMVIM